MTALPSDERAATSALKPTTKGGRLPEQAWTASSLLHNEVRAKTLFATHYHELTGLADHLADVANVHVADLAGVPDPVVDRSREVLDRLRDEQAVEARGSAGGRCRRFSTSTPGSSPSRARRRGRRGANAPLTAVRRAAPAWS